MVKINFILKVHDFSISALVDWIISVCLNITYLQIKFPKLPNGFHNEIVRLKNLKKLAVSAVEASDLKEVTLIASYNHDNAAHFLADCQEMSPGGNTLYESNSPHFERFG